MKLTMLNKGYDPRRNPIDAAIVGFQTLLVAAGGALVAMMLLAPIHLYGHVLTLHQAWNEIGFFAVDSQIRLRLLTSALVGAFAGLIAVRYVWPLTPLTEPFIQTSNGDPHVYYGENARNNLRMRFFEEAGWNARTGLYLAPNLVMPHAAELKNIMFIGAPNSGKSNVVRALVDQAIDRGDRVLLLCNKGEVTSAFSEDEAILIAAHHADSYALDLATDVADPAAALQFAQDIVPASNPPFWSDCARLVLTDVTLDVIDRHPMNWTARTLLRAALADSAIIRSSISKIDLNASPLIQSADPDADDKTVTGILTTMRSAAFANLRPLAWAWDKLPPERRFSVKRWLATDYTGARTLIVQYSPEYAGLSTLVASRLIRTIATRLADPQLSVDPRRRVVLALDEFHLLDKIEELDSALAVGREKGLVCLLGIQNYGQLVKKYGRNFANVLSDLFQIKIYGRLTPGESAEAIAKGLGERAVSAMVRNRTPGGKDTRKWIEERKSLPTFSSTRMASELGVFVNKKKTGNIRAIVHCYGQVYLLEWPFTLWRSRRKGFLPAAWLSTPPKSEFKDHPDRL